jgi:hypothetical protein
MLLASDARRLANVTAGQRHAGPYLGNLSYGWLGLSV